MRISQTHLKRERPKGGQRAARLGLKESQPPDIERKTMSVGTILLILIILMLVGALPTWPHSRSWGYYPSGGLGAVLIILIILLLLGVI
jgi:hypothetical protein